MFPERPPDFWRDPDAPPRRSRVLGRDGTTRRTSLPVGKWRPASDLPEEEERAHGFFVESKPHRLFWVFWMTSFYERPKVVPLRREDRERYRGLEAWWAIFSLGVKDVPPADCPGMPKDLGSGYDPIFRRGLTGGLVLVDGWQYSDWEVPDVDG